ncbi:hypothetical protein AB4254_08960 [Vibrio breoganii]
MKTIVGMASLVLALGGVLFMFCTASANPVLFTGVCILIVVCSKCVFVENRKRVPCPSIFKA